MGYASIKDKKQHEQDAARIRELEAQLKRERASHPEPTKQATTQSTTIDPSTIHVTTEKTAKKYKKRLIIGWILVILWVLIGLPTVAVRSSLGMEGGFVDFLFSLPLTAGIILLIVTKIQIWWNHG